LATLRAACVDNQPLAGLSQLYLDPSHGAV